MYLQVTTRCNMKCAHCCFNCEPGKGEDMHCDIVTAAIDLAYEYENSLTIGGGEPTLHPDFYAILGYALKVQDTPFIVTNGSIRDKTLHLYDLGLKGIVGVRLSYDQYHNRNMVDDDVFELFKKRDWLWGSAFNPTSGVREANSVVAQGRGRNIAGANSSECPCPDLHVYPNGDVYACGCNDAPLLGNVLTTTEYRMGLCYKDEDEW
jgi:MoaA/NifB/PqqE/SkfB family radical SAM enzyme